MHICTYGRTDQALDAGNAVIVAVDPAKVSSNTNGNIIGRIEAPRVLLLWLHGRTPHGNSWQDYYRIKRKSG